MSSLWMYVELYGLSILVRIIFPPEWRKFFVAKKRLMMTFKGRSGKIQTGKSFVVTDSRKMIREIEINSLCLLYFWFHGKNVYLVHFSPFHSWFFSFQTKPQLKDDSSSRMSSTSTTTALVTVESPPHSVKSDSSLHFSEGSDSGHHESSNAGSSQPSTPRTGSHYREVEQEIEMEEEELEENDDHDSGILGELQTEADSYSSSSDSGYGLTASNQRYIWKLRNVNIDFNFQ